MFGDYCREKSSLSVIIPWIKYKHIYQPQQSTKTAAMGTPFIAFLDPTPTLGTAWDRSLPSHQQKNTTPASVDDLNSLPSLEHVIPRTFVDAMSVREQVYVAEQGVPQENEFDDDDFRSCHWVIYASISQVVEHEQRDPATGQVIRPRRSESSSVPIGTIRLVPFPHEAHPLDGGVYVDGKLVNGDELKKPSPVSTPMTEEEKQRYPLGPVGDKLTYVDPKYTFIRDRPTSLHDGVEPYVKLGRLAVVKEFRGRGIAGQLIRAAIDWQRQHTKYWNPNPAVLGFEKLGMDGDGLVPKWRGLICCHAQEDAVKIWQKHGFQVDEGMGRWTEEGIPHVGMFLRVPL